MTFLTVFEIGVMAFFLYITAVTVSSNKLNIYEKLAAFICGLLLNTYYFIDILFRLGVIK